MTDLADFGGGVDEPADKPTDASDDNAPGYGHTYRNGRCRALTSNGQQRCSSPAEHDSPTCHMHPVDSPSTRLIDDHPTDLIEATARTPWRKFENLRIISAVREVDDA